jgi:hypothetical protein
MEDTADGNSALPTTGDCQRVQYGELRSSGMLRGVEFVAGF